MQIFSEKNRTPVWIGILCASGFLAVAIASYLAAAQAQQHTLSAQTLPLTADHIQAALDTELLRPAPIATLVAGDSLVRDWLVSEEPDSEAMLQYLAEVKQKHDAAAVFVASERARMSYSSDGIAKPMEESAAADSWFFRTRAMQTPYAASIETGGTEGGSIGLAIHHRILDRDGKLLGIAGVVLRSDVPGALIDGYRQRFGRRVYLVDARGEVTAAGASLTPSGGPFAALPGMRDIAGRLLHGSGNPVQLSYERDGEKVFVHARYLQQAGWHLIVEQDADAGSAASRQALVFSLAAGAGVSLLVLALTISALRRYQQQLERVAGSDGLTGLLNRQAFEIVYRQAALDAERSGRLLSAILFDIDFFKQVNDFHGYAAGDEVLRAIAALTSSAVRESDVIARWGGQEFVVLLKECSLEQAVAIAEKLRHAVDHHDFSSIIGEHQITVSLGIAQHEPQESAACFFGRADEALLKAKANGRNRLQVAPAGGSMAVAAAG